MQLIRFVNPHVHVVIEEAIANIALPAEPPPLDPAVVSESASGSAPDAGSEPVTEILPGEDAENYDAEDALAISLSAQLPSATLWLLDGPSPAQAQRMGLTPENLPVGTSLRVTAWPARTAGSHDLTPITITLHNGFQIRVR